jgi:hypothetical protein
MIMSSSSDLRDHQHLSEADVYPVQLPFHTMFIGLRGGGK